MTSWKKSPTYQGPKCGHGPCVNNWIETGHRHCVEEIDDDAVDWKTIAAGILLLVLVALGIFGRCAL